MRSDSQPGKLAALNSSHQGALSVLLPQSMRSISGFALYAVLCYTGHGTVHSFPPSHGQSFIRPVSVDHLLDPALDTRVDCRHVKSTRAPREIAYDA